MINSAGLSRYVGIARHLIGSSQTPGARADGQVQIVDQLKREGGAAKLKLVRRLH